MNSFPPSSPVFAERAKELRATILHSTSQLSPAAQDTVFLGIWSMVDLIAHRAGWEFTNLTAAKDIQAGKLPEF
jgi:hypothetical protein